MTRKTLGLLAVPVVGTVMLLAYALARQTPARAPEISSRPLVRPERPRVPVLPEQVPLAPPPPPMPHPAPEKTVAVAMDEARLKTTYENYRSALAVGNASQAQVLRGVLVRERGAALRLAEQDLAQAKETLDRSIAQKAVDSLRR